MSSVGPGPLVCSFSVWQTQLVCFNLQKKNKTKKEKTKMLLEPHLQNPWDFASEPFSDFFVSGSVHGARTARNNVPSETPRGRVCSAHRIQNLQGGCGQNG